VTMGRHSQWGRSLWRRLRPLWIVAPISTGMPMGKSGQTGWWCVESEGKGIATFKREMIEEHFLTFVDICGTRLLSAPPLVHECTS
jgi:hypothetical protein